MKRSQILGSLFVLALVPLLVFAQENEKDLRETRVTIHETEKPLYTVFSRLIQQYDIPIGFEESSLDRNSSHFLFATNIATRSWAPEYRGDRHIYPSFPVQHPDNKVRLISVNVVNARLENVMDSIVAQMEHYEWTINDGVVNIYPVKGRDERLTQLLDTPIKEFKMGSGEEVGWIQANIVLFLPEFKSFVTKNGLDVATHSLSPGFENRPLTEGIGIVDSTFREMLNKITQSKRGGWILRITSRAKTGGKDTIEVHI